MDPWYRCSHPGCESKFRTRFNLNRHFEARHLRIKRYQCGVCELRLSSKHALREHMHIHTGVKPYMCSFPGCYQFFRHASQLSFHRKANHEDSSDETVHLYPIDRERSLNQRNIKLPLHEALANL